MKSRLMTTDLKGTAMSRARSRLIGLVCAVTVAAGNFIPSLSIADEGTGGLNQVIDSNQQFVDGRVVLDEGHIDFGPTLGTGEWAIKIHDDTSIPRYWRDPSDVVIKVNDEAKLTVPDDPAYSFLGAQPGSDVYVIPQAQKASVIWAGWNTQEPQVLERVDLGATMTLKEVNGPGNMVVYLQSGNFGEPQKLYSTYETLPQSTWIEVNTHTHANWVFTQPGIYLVKVGFSAKDRQGNDLDTDAILRFAVGSDADVDTAFNATMASSDSTQASEESQAVPASSDHSGMPTFIWVVIGIVAAAALIAVIVIAIAHVRLRNSVRASRSASVGESAAQDGTDS